MSEIRECKQQVQELIRQANVLSARINKLAENETERLLLTQIEQNGLVEQAVPIKTAVTPTQKSASQMPKPVTPTQRFAEQVKTRNTFDERKAQLKAEKQKRNADLENQIGKNIFAILASLLVLIGVGIFISTFYDYIPEIVKIAMIYIFGFAVLGVGLKSYQKGKNNFWLGVASCGMAELLVSIITSHTYFGVISLPITYVMIILWVVGSFALTKYHPIVFKTIGYIGFWASTLLGQSLLGNDDGIIYLSLWISFVVLTVLFMLSNKECKKLNTAIAFISTLGLTMFQDMEYYLNDFGFGFVCVASLAIVVGLNYLYLFNASLTRKVYPFYSIASTIVSYSLLLSFCETEVIIPIMLAVMLALWWVNGEYVEEKKMRLNYSAFMILITILVASGADATTQMWFAVSSLVSYTLFSMTRKRDIAWFGFASFAVFTMSVGAGFDAWTIFALVAAIMFLCVNHSKIVRNDPILQLAWYLLSIVLLSSNYNEMIYMLVDATDDIAHGYSFIRDINECILYFALAVINTIYLHLSIRDNEKIMKADFKGIALMIVQGIIFNNCMACVDDVNWFVAAVGIASSLMIISYSLIYSVKTKWENQRIVVWQFIKFTIYCFWVLSMLEASSVIIHIVLLLMAIAAIVFGFKLGHKSVRIYGLILSILDVVSLVLFSIDYDNSLQFAGGVILCGILCFVISFIYSKISKTVETAQIGEPKIEQIESHDVAPKTQSSDEPNV